MLKRLLLFLSFCFVSIGVALGQNITVKGTVLDENSEPVMGATVRLKSDATKGAITDLDGNFTLQAKSGETLIISYVGYKTQEVAAKATLTIRLVPDNEMLEEVVVTALGLERQKRDLGYATAKVNAKELTQAKSVDIASSLQGKVAGLNISGLNSGVFNDVRINLRGIRSLTGGNNPMLLLDGVPVDLSFLSSINPNDVKDINVLKGTSAAAIYGPDARNGVIVVTTKNGDQTTKPVVTVSSSVQASMISFFPKFQQEFGSGGASQQFPEFISYENESWGPEYDGQPRQLGKPDEEGNIMEYPYSPTNARQEFFNTGLTFQNDISFATKDFYISAQDASISGILPQDKNHRMTLRATASKEYKNFKATFNANYIKTNYDIFSSSAMYDAYSALNVGMHDGIMDLVFATQAWVPLNEFTLDNHWGDYNRYYNEYSLNPYQAIDTWRNMGNENQFLGNVELKYSPFEWMDINYRVALSYFASNGKSTGKAITPNAHGLSRSFKAFNQSVSESIGLYSRVTSEPFITFHHTWDKWKINAILGSYYRSVLQNNVAVGASPLVIEGLYNISARTGEPGASHSMSQTKMLSFYGSLAMTYDDWATVEVTGRNDKVSVLAPEHSSFFYPGVNASLVLTDAIPGMKTDFMNFMKLRGSWNLTGNTYLGAYNLARSYSQEGGYPYDGQVGFYPSRSTVDPNIKPEFINSFEVGLETTVFNNKATLDLTYYNQKNSDQVIGISSSYASGVSSLTTNAASFVNYGLEASLKLNGIIQKGDFYLDLGANYSYNNSEILSLYEGMDELQMAGYFMAMSVAKVGYPAFVWSVSDYIRDDQGRVIVDKVTGMPTKDESKNVIKGRTLPLHIMGLNATLGWKGLRLSTVFEYKGGYNTFNYQFSTMGWDGQSRITAANHRERFVFPNSVYDKNQGIEGAKPEYVPNENITINTNYGYFHEDVYRSVGSNAFFSANSWRWRELTLSYEFPKSLLSKTNVISGLELAFTARNLMLWLPRSNEWADPDFSISSSTSYGGTVTSAINPPTRTIGGAITITF